MTAERLHTIPPVEIDSMDPILFSYLLGLQSIPPTGVLRFGWCTQAQQELVNDTKLVHVLNEEDRAEAEEALAADLANPDYTGLEDIARALHEFELEEQAIAERVRTVDVIRTGDNAQIAFGPITHGHATSGSFAVHDGGVSLFAIHTHPDDILFSPADYAALITDTRTLTDNLRQRNLFGQMVICPSVQVFALATAQTPLIPEVETEEFLRRMRQDALEEVTSDPNETRIEIPSRLITDAIKMDPERFLRIIQSQTTRMRAGELTPSIRKEEFKEFYRSCGEIGQLIIEALEINLTIESRQLNAMLIQIARRLHIQLYFSTDMAVFIPASA